MTAADGTFTVADAAGVYQLTLISAEHHVALVVDGLGSREPSVQLPIEYDERSSRSLTGFVSGDLDASSSFLDFAFVSPEGVLGRAFRSPDTVAANGFGVPLNWAGPEAQAGTLYALQGKHVGAGIEYTGFADAPVSWTFEEAVMADLVLVDPPQLAFEGTFTVPEGYEISFAYTDIGPFELPLNVSQGAFFHSGPRDIPLASSVRFLLNDATSNVIIRREVPESGMLSIDIPAAAKPVLPIDDATGVSATTMFSWTEAPANTISSARFNLGDWTITRIVQGHSTTLPDLAAYGLPLPAAGAGTWTVRVEGPAATVDELLALQDLYPETQWSYRSAPDLFFSYAHTFSFTTSD